MGLIRRIADCLEPAETRHMTSWDLMRGADLSGAYPANPRAAENLSTVLACVGAISSATASLPAYIYKFTDGGRTIDDLHPVSRLIDRGPNQNQPWPDFVEWTMASVLLRGNALSEIVTDSRGAVVGLNPIPWDQCSVQLLPNRKLVYDISDVTYIGGGSGRVRRLLQDEVFHLRDRSDDGLVGVSRLRRAAAVIQAGLSIQDFGNNLYRNGAFPSGAIQTDLNLGGSGKQMLRSMFEDQFTNTHNTARILILDQGLKWEKISMSAEDAEFLASRKFTTEELCRIFNVPPVIVGDLSNSSFNNTETLTRFFAQSTLTPWIKKIESEFSRSVFSEASRGTHKLEIDLSGLLRGDPQQRWQSYDIAIRNQILTRDEIREIEGFGPLPQPSA